MKRHYSFNMSRILVLMIMFYVLSYIVRFVYIAVNSCSLLPHFLYYCTKNAFVCL